jgi:hypothetical protein
MDSLFITLLPPLIAISANIFWKLAYVGRRPLSRGVKLIVAAIIGWSLGPLLVLTLLYLLAASGHNLGD